MPMVKKCHFICPITGIEVVSDAPNMPERWGNVNGEVFSPQGIGILARRIVAHPDESYQVLTTTPYPDSVLDA